MTGINIEQNVIEVAPTPNHVIEVNNNPIAIKGEDGIGFVSQEFIRTSPSTEWIINHNKGYYPSVLVFDMFNKIAIAEIEHVSLNQVRIYFSSEQIGKAIIN